MAGQHGSPPPSLSIPARLLRVVDAPSLGQGSNFRASLCEYSGAQCVVKSLIQDAASADPRVLASVDAELGALASLPQHPNVLRFFGVCSDRGRGVELVLQLAEGGSLTDVAAGFPGGMPLPKLARYAAGVARGLAHLHAHRLSHNDLKPDNVLLDGAGAPLLADFGTVRLVGAVRAGSIGELGTWRYMAPENGIPGDPNRGKPPADVFSFGLMLFELATGGRLWPDMSDFPTAVALAAGRRPDIPAALGAGLRDLITGCWAPTPGDRPTAAQAEQALSRMAAEVGGCGGGGGGASGGGAAFAPSPAWGAKLAAARAAGGFAAPAAEGERRRAEAAEAEARAQRARAEAEAQRWLQWRPKWPH
jgi:serine/threonine protein kinase